jgi:hypothetical protein
VQKKSRKTTREEEMEKKDEKWKQSKISGNRVKKAKSQKKRK